MYVKGNGYPEQGLKLLLVEGLIADLLSASNPGDRPPSVPRPETLQAH